MAKSLTRGFKIEKMRVIYFLHPEWDVPLDPEVMKVFEQPFHYIDKGSQCYVFESEDQKTVIKFFRFDERKSNLKIFTLFNAAHIAFERLKRETGLLYIHLNPTELGLPTLRCSDAIGRTYHLALDECRFAVQKKVQTFESAMREAKENPELMKRRIDQLIDLLKARAEKGVFNSDPSLSRNFGFLENRAIEIDFGNYRPLIPHTKEQEVERYTERLKRYLNQNAPEWVSYLEDRIGASFENAEMRQKV
jgi:hypothetical protein